MEMYFVAIVLPEDLNKKVLHYKTLMLERFNCTVGLKSPAHITIIPPFWLNEELEASLKNDIETISAGITPFSITTNNIAAFKPRTIFIDVENNSALNNAKEQAETVFIKKEQYKIKLDKRPYHPHITIATRDLTKKAFYEGWELLQNEVFKEAWLADCLCLLKHNKKNWDVIYTSQFKN
jgi:2'-5' RNA ligase